LFSLLAAHESGAAKYRAIIRRALVRFDEKAKSGSKSATVSTSKIIDRI